VLRFSSVYEVTGFWKKLFIAKTVCVGAVGNFSGGFVGNREVSRIKSSIITGCDLPPNHEVHIVTGQV